MQQSNRSRAGSRTPRTARHATRLVDGFPLHICGSAKGAVNFDKLAAARALLADGSCLIVGDERVSETFTALGDQVERLMYGFSMLHCLPASRTETPSAATGTVLRPATLRACTTEAGFARVEVLPIENDMWRFYRLKP